MVELKEILGISLPTHYCVGWKNVLCSNINVSEANIGLKRERKKEKEITIGN